MLLYQRQPPQRNCQIVKLPVRVFSKKGKKKRDKLFSKNDYVLKFGKLLACSLHLEVSISIHKGRENTPALLNYIKIFK